LSIFATFRLNKNLTAVFRHSETCTFQWLLLVLHLRCKPWFLLQEALLDA